MTENITLPEPEIGKPPYRRAIEIRLSDDGQSAVAELEDDHHHFAVHVRAENGRVAAIRGEAIRRPWTLCALAAAELRKLEGMEIAGDPTAVLEQANIREQCTHMFDLAGLAIAALGRGKPAFRRYDMIVRPLGEALWESSLVRDDGYALLWRVTLQEIIAPERFAGISVKSSFVDTMRAMLDADEFEAALVLRRAQFVGKFRHRIDIDLRVSAGEGGTNIGGCFVLQPERAMQALRMKGATISFPEEGPPPLASGADGRVSDR